MAKKVVKFMITAFRDGFQSVFGTRVLSKDYLPVVEEAAKAGITHIEAGGGAMFQAPFFYANENSYDIMDTFRKIVGPDVELQTLARGINVVALDSQPRDIIDLHAKMFKKHGMTTIRNFDALNDVNNLIYSGQCIKNAGLKHEVVVAMMELPPGCEGAHTAEFYMATLKKILDAGIPYDSIAFKDASGTSTPQKVYETIKAARKMLGDKVKLAFHSHETAGTCITSYKAAIEAGIDQVDLSLAPVSGGTCSPDVLTMWHALRGTDYDLNIDVNKIIKLENRFKDAMKDYFIPPEAMKVEPVIPFFPMPGGALTANTQMLRDNGLMDKYSEVIAAMGETVKKGGFGTSVTPVSQFYFQQAFNNVMFGEWKKIAEGYGKMVLGYFGKTPVAPDAQVVKIAQEQLKLDPTTENPLDINDRNPKKGIPVCKKMLEDAGLPINDENIFLVASCGDKGILYLQGKAPSTIKKNAGETEKKEEKKESPNGYVVTINNKDYAVKLNGNVANVNGVDYNISVKDGVASAAQPAAAGSGTPVTAPMPGLILRITAKVGDVVKEGQNILVMESMKMETPINAVNGGTIVSINVSQGQQVKSGTVLYTIK